jgi:hypothetical protein
VREIVCAATSLMFADAPMASATSKRCSRMSRARPATEPAWPPPSVLSETSPLTSFLFSVASKSTTSATSCPARANPDASNAATRSAPPPISAGT